MVLWAVFGQFLDQSEEDDNGLPVARLQTPATRNRSFSVKALIFGTVRILQMAACLFGYMNVVALIERLFYIHQQKAYCHLIFIFHSSTFACHHVFCGAFSISRIRLV
jgi:hypothetical protein